MRRCWRGSTGASRRWCSPPGILTAGALLISAVGWRDLLATDWGALPVLVWIALGYIVVFATIATFMLLQVASLRLPASKVMAYTYLTPSWVLLWEMALGHGAALAQVLPGVALTVAALAILLRRDRDGAVGRCAEGAGAVTRSVNGSAPFC